LFIKCHYNLLEYNIIIFNCKIFEWYKIKLALSQWCTLQQSAHVGRYLYIWHIMCYAILFLILYYIRVNAMVCYIIFNILLYYRYYVLFGLRIWPAKKKKKKMPNKLNEKNLPSWKNKTKSINIIIPHGVVVVAIIFNGFS